MCWTAMYRAAALRYPVDAQTSQCCPLLYMDSSLKDITVNVLGFHFSHFVFLMLFKYQLLLIRER